MDTHNLYPGLAAYLGDRREELSSIAAERRTELEQLAAFIRGAVQSDDAARLVFICTHNSRRSHLGQICGDCLRNLHCLGYDVHWYHVKFDLKPIRISGLGKELLGSFGIVLVGLQIAIIGESLRREP